MNEQSGSHIETVAAPEITLVSESIGYTASITGPEGAEIRYTTDYGTPTVESTLYTGPFHVADGDRVSAIAILNGVCSTMAYKDAGLTDME